jgi:hypothetical protein
VSYLRHHRSALHRLMIPEEAALCYGLAFKSHIVARARPTPQVSTDQTAAGYLSTQTAAGWSSLSMMLSASTNS